MENGERWINICMYLVVDVHTTEENIRFLVVVVYVLAGGLRSKCRQNSF